MIFISQEVSFSPFNDVNFICNEEVKKEKIEYDGKNARREGEAQKLHVK